MNVQPPIDVSTRGVSFVVRLTPKGVARYRAFNTRFLNLAATMGADLREADIRNTADTVRRLSDELRARSERLS